jgi:isopenicillin-N N-acyltransferase-like protein
MRRLDLRGTPEELGTAFGTVFDEEIRAYLEDRLARSKVGTGFSSDRLRRLAADCLPAHRRYAPDLYEEMTAMSEAAGLTPAEAVIVGGYTDFIDTVRSAAGTGPAEDDCTAVMVPDSMAGGSGYLAQTWDMHASSTEHVVLLRVRPGTGPAALVFTTVGCLGQIGMNEAGLAVGINNLTAADGQVGVTWPFIVRKVLQQTDFDLAVKAVLEADLAGGHNFLLFDISGRGVNIEAMPSHQELTELEARPLVHANHCLFEATRRHEAERPAVLVASSEARMRDAAAWLERPPITERELMAMTRDPNSICRRPEPPFDYETCGAVIMRPGRGDLWAVWGLPAENEYEHFRFDW